jgi:hypothetical protein
MTPPAPAQPLISYPALQRALSPQRLDAYALPGDPDETARVARYAWNLALVNALAPTLHVLEVAFRNEIARAASRITAGRVLRHGGVASWLDAVPSMLMEHERRKVASAKAQLRARGHPHTEGHLIAKLDFGFWVALCRDSYADTRGDGPRLWPRALGMAFTKRPASVAGRAEIHLRFDHIRAFRNRVAHHEPIWDRDYLAEHDRILDSLAWISPRLADTLRATSRAAEVHAAGHEGYLPLAEAVLRGGAALRPPPVAALPRERQVLVHRLCSALLEAPEADAHDVARGWARTI